MRRFGETEFGMGAALAGRRTGAAVEEIEGAPEKAQLLERSFRTALLRGRAVPCSG